MDLFQLPAAAIHINFHPEENCNARTLSPCICESISNPKIQVVEDHRGKVKTLVLNITAREMHGSNSS